MDTNERSTSTASTATSSTASAAPATRAAPVVVMGVDPGTLVVGYGAVVEASPRPRLFACGAIRADPKADVPTRLAQIRAELDVLLAKIRPTIVVVEQAFAARNVQSALRIGEGRGVVLACAACFGARIEQFAPAVAKRAIVGHGAADKTQVARMVGEVLGLVEPPKPLDATDALALALALVQRRALELRLGAGNATLAMERPRGRRAGR